MALDTVIWNVCNMPKRCNYFSFFIMKLWHQFFMRLCISVSVPSDSYLERVLLEYGPWASYYHYFHSLPQCCQSNSIILHKYNLNHLLPHLFHFTIIIIPLFVWIHWFRILHSPDLWVLIPKLWVAPYQRPEKGSKGSHKIIINILKHSTLIRRVVGE